MASQASSSRAGSSTAGEPAPGPRQGDPGAPSERGGPAPSSQGAAGAPQPRLASFEAFWPYYVGEHANPWTRRLHFVGTTAAGLSLASAIVSRRPGRILGALVAGYGPAWASHFFVEKNRPATFTYPLWSLLADFKMWSMIARGTMDAEVARVLAEREAAAPPPVATSPHDAGSNGAGSNGAARGDAAFEATLSEREPSGVLN